MRYLFYVLLFAPIAVVPGACRRGGANGELSEKNDQAATQASTKPVGPVADNRRCYVCHMNYEDEELVLVHAKGNVGCEKCHGESDAHCDDEDNVTPPDKMYSKGAINLSCLKCHYEIANDEQHKPILAGMAKEEFCTDCHGEHRLAHRERRWDKKTGELLATGK